jgi:WD40-like Beta Propeller Repeat
MANSNRAAFAKFFVAAALVAAVSGCSPLPPGAAQPAGRQPHLFPYPQGTVIPPNIAPLNFVIRETGNRFYVSIIKNGRQRIVISSAAPSIAVPAARWKRLLAEGPGPIGFNVYCRRGSSWVCFETIWDTVSTDAIDPSVVYRKLPMCKDWTSLGLYQRSTGNFEERIVFHNKYNGACFNCHSFRSNSAGAMAFQVRSTKYGTPMVLATPGSGVRAVNTKTAFTSGKVGFTSWHPFLDIIAFSMNRFQMMFFSSGIEPRAVFDGTGDCAVFDMRTNSVSSTPLLCRKDRIETMPEWSRDGRWLYFCSAPQLPESRYRDIRCDLVRISFDPDMRTWGKLDTVLSAAKAGGSVLQPRCSPDGRFLLVNISPWGDFPVDKTGTCLALLDTADRSVHRLFPDTLQTDTWHSWSSNGRWIAFNSKRINGRFSSIFFCHVDSAGNAHLPFVMPQKNPRFYESSLSAYNVPEFTTEAIPCSPRQLQAALDAYRVKPAVEAVSSASVTNAEGGEY